MRLLDENYKIRAYIPRMDYYLVNYALKVMGNLSRHLLQIIQLIKHAGWIGSVQTFINPYHSSLRIRSSLSDSSSWTNFDHNLIKKFIYQLVRALFSFLEEECVYERKFHPFLQCRNVHEWSASWKRLSENEIMCYWRSERCAVRFFWKTGLFNGLEVYWRCIEATYIVSYIKDVLLNLT